MSTLVKLAYSSIHWFYGHNTRKDSFGNPLADVDAKPKDDGYIAEGAGGGLVQSLRNGWRDNQGNVTVEKIEDYAKRMNRPAAEVIAEINAERLKLIESYESIEDKKRFAVVMRAIWLPGGKPVKVTHVANDCYRRSLAVIGVIHNRTNSAGAMDYSFMVSCSETTFQSGLSALMSHIEENQKDVGRSRYSSQDYILIGQKLFQEHGNELQLRRICGDGNGQKIWAFIRLDVKFPALRLSERAMMDVKNPEFLSIASLNKDEIRRLADGFHYNDTAKLKRIEIKESDVQSYIADKNTGSVTKAMNAKQIGEFIQGSPVKFVASIGEAILKDNRFYILQVLNPLAEQLNAAFDAILNPKDQTQPVKQGSNKQRVKA